MQILHIDSSPKEDISNSRQLSRYCVAQLQAKYGNASVDYLDLAAEPIPHIDGLFAKATYTPKDQRSPDMVARLAQSDALCERVLAADVIVAGIPMHNWCYPSVFKVFIDQITRTDVTYGYLANGDIGGLLTRQKCIFITTRGADLAAPSPYQNMDALTPALRAAFGFIGVEDMTFVDVQPLQFADQQAHHAAMQQGEADIRQVLAGV
ncbi:FMN-dependent NADH-azoreductase [Halioxenophilus aromaticivorans]|uniref:FMN dependent NADH:quinone oxidoreductase n=1 Tax=Halioxenophilus aromaticivorans TaxID=1306992 RepID=A0AAV3U5N1_9ALTE